MLDYLIFLGNALHGDLGTSYLYRLDVMGLVLDKLGLKLVPQKSPVDLYVIESVEKPTGN